MRNRRLVKLATGLTVGLAALGLLALPAAALHDTEDAEVTSGTLDLYDEFGGLVDSINLGDPSAVTCDNSLVSTITMDDSTNPDTWTATMDSDTAIGLGFRVRLQASFSGTYSGGGLSGSGSAQATLQRTVSPYSCTPDTDYGPCLIDASNIVVGGTYVVPGAPNIVTGNTTTVNGGNAYGNFETQVSGDQPGDCGSLIALNNGGIELVDVVLTAITG